jgi:NADH dehydrogenase
VAAAENAFGPVSVVETAGAINDLVREAVRYYPELSEELVRVIIVHPGEVLLPELGEELGHYASASWANVRSKC